MRLNQMRQDILEANACRDGRTGGQLPSTRFVSGFRLSKSNYVEETREIRNDRYVLAK